MGTLVLQENILYRYSITIIINFGKTVTIWYTTFQVIIFNFSFGHNLFGNRKRHVKCENDLSFAKTGLVV